MNTVTNKFHTPDEATEEYVKSVIAGLEQWNTTYGIHVAELEKLIDQLLLSEDFPQLCSFIENGNFMKHYNCSERLALVILYSQIYNSETKRQPVSINHIFCNIHSIDDAVVKWNSLKFLIIDIEFDFNRQQSLSELKELLYNNKLSATSLAYLIKYVAVNHKPVYEQIIIFLQTHSLYRIAQSLITESEEITGTL